MREKNVFDVPNKDVNERLVGNANVWITIEVCSNAWIAHADLFSRHASPLEVYVLVLAVDESGEDVMSDEICRRCNGKQQIM